MAKKARVRPPPERTFDALPDTVDFRDALFVPTLVRVAPTSDLKRYRSYGLPVLDQQREGACTGFGLAAVANYLLRIRGEDPHADEVSAWMLYAMAKRYDEWPGEDYEGSSARGAMKGWFKHGLCALALWNERVPDDSRSAQRSADALSRPLGAYFRVNHKDLVAMHSAIAEVGILFATASVHMGWQKVEPGCEDIAYEPGTIGGHAFAIVGYDRLGFWIQNSWGPGWGSGGLARLSYPDWLANGKDVWVAALGAPIDLGQQAAAAAAMRSSAPYSYQSRIYADLRQHIITAKNDGILDDKGMFGMTKAGLRTLIGEHVPARMAGWKKKRLLLYAHGGLVSQDSAVQMVSSNLDFLLRAEVYPLSFIWRSDAWTTLRNILQDAVSQRRDEGLLDSSKDFMLDRLDDMIEVVAGNLGGKALWDEMKENAEGATGQAQGAARLAADQIIKLVSSDQLDEVHLVGHSAGSIFLAPVTDYLVAHDVKIKSMTLWAPACTVQLFNDVYRPGVENGQIESFDLYTLDDQTEQDDNCANLYFKSLLYLVSHAFEARPRIPWIRDGVPLLGMQRHASDIKGFWNSKSRRWILAPGPDSRARHHGEFDNDAFTLESTLRRVTGAAVAPDLPSPTLTQPAAARSTRRRLFNQAFARPRGR